MIHVVFEEANIEALKKSFQLDPSLDGEVICINDDYAVGPLNDIFSPEGIEERKKWWHEVLQDGHYHSLIENNQVDDAKTVSDLKQTLTQHPDELVWMWAAQNKHDVSGYYWLMSQLKDFQGRIFILYLNNLPFINEKGNIFYPTNLFQIQPKEFVKAKKLARPITLSEFEIDPDEWLKLCKENKGVRLLEGGKKLSQKSYNYYDDSLLSFIGKEWVRGSKLLQQYYSKAKETTGDAYLLWRLKQMAGDGKIDMQGSFANMKEFDVKLASADMVDSETALA